MNLEKVGSPRERKTEKKKKEGRDGSANSAVWTRAVFLSSACAMCVHLLIHNSRCIRVP